MVKIAVCPGSRTPLHTFLAPTFMEPYYDAMKANRDTAPVACPVCGVTVHTYRDDTGVRVGAHT